MDGRKCYKKARMDETILIRFQETGNGGFRKRISVDRVLKTTDPYNVLVQVGRLSSHIEGQIQCEVVSLFFSKT